MRFQTYMRRVIGETAPEACTFGPDHYREAGVNFAPIGGMPQLEAHQLVNQWNSGQHTPRFIYWLEA